MLLLLFALLVWDPACPASIKVEEIDPVRGEGYTWVKATYIGASEPATAPDWTAINADILPYSEDPMLAYMMAPTGTYTVIATACGVVGEAKIDHEAMGH